MTDLIEPSKEQLPTFVSCINNFLRDIFSRRFVILLSVLIVLVSIYWDNQHQQSHFLGKSGGLITILGLLLTIKHRFLTDVKSFEDYANSVWNAGAFAESYITPEQRDQIKEVSITKTTGFLLICLGTIISFLG